MLQNYLKVAFRNLLRNKGYSFINISGLTVGLTCSLLIFLFVQDELSFDKFHTDYKQIHRLKADRQIGDFRAIMDFPAGMKSELEEVLGVEQVVRIRHEKEVIITNQSENFKENGFIYTDPSFLTLFNFSLKAGDPKTALNNPGSIILSKEIVVKYYKDQNPIGTLISINNEDFTVTGVFNSLPKNTHLEFSMVASLSGVNETQSNPWAIFPDYDTYLKIDKAVDISSINDAAYSILEKNVENASSEYNSVFSSPLQNIYFSSGDGDRTGLRGSIKYVRIFVIIGLFILGIASINYMNLSTAKASNRSLEIGIRKTSGAFRNQLIKQFLTESLLFSFLSALLCLLLIDLILPEFNKLTGKSLILDFSNWVVGTGIFVVTVFTGVIAGFYPAMLLSKLKPISTLKGQYKSGKAALYLRRGLVSFQFILTVGLIFSAIIFNRQFNLLMETGIGINTQALISIPLNEQVSKNFQSFKTQLLSSPDVQSASTGRLLGGISPHIFSPDEGGLKTKSGIIDVLSTDFDFIETLQLQLVAGRELSDKIANDSKSGILINATAVKELGFSEHEEVLGQNITLFEKEYIIQGVVQDFYNTTARMDILPMAIAMGNVVSNQALVRINSKNVSASINFLKTTWGNFDSFEPFEFAFVDDKVQVLYQTEQNIRKIFTAFALLAITIACLGLLGLINYSIEQKKKEIGIRKVLGASINNILLILSREFLWLIGIGFTIAIPVSWYFMREWLKNYTIKVPIGTDTILISASIVLLITIITVSFQTVKAALSNPVDTLNSE